MALFPPRKIDEQTSVGGGTVPVPGPLQDAANLINAGATFGLSLKLPDLPIFPGLALGVGLSTPKIPFSLCGFKIPFVAFNLSFSLPPFTLPLPGILLALGISCDGLLNGHPLQFAAAVPWGGGRVGTMDADEDLPPDDQR